MTEVELRLPAKKQCNATLCDVTSWLVLDLPLKSCECYIVFCEVSTTSLYNVHQNSLPLTTNLLQKPTQPSEGISYPVSDLCQRFKKLTGPCAYTLHSNLIPLTDGTNGLF